VIPRPNLLASCEAAIVATRDRDTILEKHLVLESMQNDMAMQSSAVEHGAAEWGAT